MQITKIFSFKKFEKKIDQLTNQQESTNRQELFQANLLKQ